MLVTFKSNASGDVTMFYDVAKKLIKLMGQSGAVPSGINSAGIPDALRQLRDGLGQLADEDTADERDDRDDDSEPPVPLATRAYPLIRMLEEAEAEQCSIVWSLDAVTARSR